MHLILQYFPFHLFEILFHFVDYFHHLISLHHQHVNVFVLQVQQILPDRNQKMLDLYKNLLIWVRYYLYHRIVLVCH
jgi:hypothetical protein